MTGTRISMNSCFEDILGKAIRSIASGIEGMDDALEKAQAECEQAFNR